MYLTPSQAAAIKYIEEYAARTDTLGVREIENVLAMTNTPRARYEKAQEQIKNHARIGLQFHPDRLDVNNEPVIKALIKDGCYKNQFETHLSNGGLDPYEGGRRDRWENDVFGGVFTKHDAALSERPKYGALDLMRFPDGPCPRYGSCFFLCEPHLSSRSTFTYMDSHRNPKEKGTLKVFDPIMAALMTECFERRFALGRNDIFPPELIDHLLANLDKSFRDPSGLKPARNLNHYIEAQVHGTVSLREDIAVLVADPSFKDTEVEDSFDRLCNQYDIDLLWHCGFRLAVEDVPDDFRGPTMPSLARRVSSGGHVDPFIIGVAAADLKRNPKNWADRGAYEDVLQELKLLWHVLVQFGGRAV